MTQKMLIIDPEKCIGCRTCEMVCSLSHSGGCSATRSRVRVVMLETQDKCIPILCNHCETPACQRVCPTNAISRDKTTGAVLLDTFWCLGCRACFSACPFGIPSFDPFDRVMIKCDLCKGDPECAKFCPSGAIQYIRNDDITAAKRKAGAIKMLQDIVKAPS